jgi:dTDP-4-amino-4,6-dideoxygalactose transaminase
VQAAVLLVKLKRLSEWNAARRRHAEYYSTRLRNEKDVVLPQIGTDGRHVFHLYVARVPARDRVLEFLRNHGVGAGIHYPIPTHLLPASAHLGYRAGDFPITEKLSGEILSLPLYPELTSEQADFIISTLKAALQNI